MLNPFLEACRNGDEKTARELYDSDKSLLNLKSSGYMPGTTGLIFSIIEKHYSITGWLLSLPGLDVNMKLGRVQFTAFHLAAVRKEGIPLELLITLATLASKETINLKITNDGYDEHRFSGSTALDIAVKEDHPSTAIYLSWLGAQCKEENRKFGDVTLQTWLDAGCQQDAPMWAVAANDLKALRKLASMAEVIFDKPILLKLANLFGHQEIKYFLKENQNLKIYSNQVFCDFEITFKEFTFPCHKSFLANLSSAFQGLIEDKTRQNLPMKTELLNCPNEAVAESLVKFFYIGAIDKDLLEWHSVSFLHLADFYQIKELYKTVEDVMIAQLCKENVKEFLIAADKYQSEKVKASCFDFLYQNRGIWSENIEEWKPYISRELMCEIIIKLA